MHVVEHIFPRKHSALWQAARPRSVHREHRHDDVESEIVVQPPGAKQSEIQRGPAHFRPMHTHQPGPRLRVAEQQRVLEVVCGVALPPLRTRFAWMRRVSAVEEDAVKGVSVPLDLSYRNI